MMQILRNQKGASSLFVMVIMGLFLSVIGYVTVSSVLTDARGGAAYWQSTQAFWLAESGVEVAQRWLRYQNQPPSGITPFVQFDDITAGIGELGELLGDIGTYTVTFVPDAENASSYLKTYKIVSTGNVDGVQRQIEVEVMATTFNYYAYLTGSEGGTIWFNSGDVIEGPSHSNDQISITQDPVFMGKVTSSASSFNQGSPYYPDFQEGYQLGVPPVIFPEEQDVINNYYASNENAPALEIDASGSKHARIVFNSNGTLTYDVWHYGGWGTIIYDIEDASANVSQLNGLIWVNGDVQVEGTLNGEVTVVSTDDMYINDDIRYNCSDSDGRPSDDCDDLLGLISFEDVVVKYNSANSDDVVINASILTLGDSFTVENYNYGSERGDLTIWGSLSQKVRGPVGTFSWWSGYRTGYEKDYHYDDRLAEVPPPYFPSTGQYHSNYWKEVTD